jgi:transposase
VSASKVRLRLKVKRFRCETESCPRTTFVESFPHLIARYARRTERLHTAHEAIAFALGGQAGSRLADKLQVPISGDTLLRNIRDRNVPLQAEPEVIGVDDWAKRRGRVYGTIVVDLERRRVIDLLTDRTAETLANWLRAHPSVKIVARDRSSEYARGISSAAPQAEQVADRWHLLVNLREAFERSLDRLRPELNALVPINTPTKSAEIPQIRGRHRSKQAELARRNRQKRRQALHAEIQRLQKEGHAVRAIARQMDKSRTTIYKYLTMPEFPQKMARKRIPSMLDPYLDYLSQRWQAGCRNALQLWREICELGYPGSRRQVSRWAFERREHPAPTTPRKHLKKGSPDRAELKTIREPPGKQRLPVARRLVWLFLHSIEKLKPEEKQLRDQLMKHPVLVRAYKLAHDFQSMVREREAHAFEGWLHECEGSNIPEFVNLAHGMRKDYLAIQAALRSNWSNGQTEGHINRLKLLKRQMYGRANFDLLRLRYLHPP